MLIYMCNSTQYSVLRALVFVVVIEKHRAKDILAISTTNDKLDETAQPKPSF